MARLIDATRIEQFILNNCSDNEEINTIYAELINAPSIDLVRCGEWKISSFTGNWYCSICGNEPYHSNLKNMNYCPNCGAKMERRADDDETD